ncbi:beta-propeller fold lactonase family protein [Hydrogenoanaerobacterium sp.]|uniref:lactonase family protein n=1 Tax=Hydrogenoanaerobacterium sp. TaxID=2953763 RepID=UPI0028A12A50|nr:beta-propeller fold lactonase family protein [Hydrogenoanaerobacterium sp.]
MVFSMSNAVNNSIVAIKRDMTGMLSDAEVYMTHGNGTGEPTVDPLGSQGSVILSGDGRFLFAVNAGSNNISSFLVQQDRLMLVDVAYSGGIRPNSLAAIDNFLYVTNSGDATHPSNVTGFQVSADGHLSQISGGTMPLSAANAGPACVVISNLGHKLVVSEKTTNALSIYQVQSDGTLLSLKIYRSIGTVPFGSAFLNNNLLFVSEAGPNALSSYNVAADGVLTVISGSVLNHQKATCWVSVDSKGKRAYTSNAGSGTITNYLISNDGSLTVDGSIPSTRQGTGAPLDSAIDRSGQNFYVLNGNEGSISVFETRNGHLSLLQVYKDTKLPQVGAQGLAVL